jgi:hypothetical protein
MGPHTCRDNPTGSTALNRCTSLGWLTFAFTLSHSHLHTFRLHGIRLPLKLSQK